MSNKINCFGTLPIFYRLSLILCLVTGMKRCAHSKFSGGPAGSYLNLAACGVYAYVTCLTLSKVVAVCRINRASCVFCVCISLCFPYYTRNQLHTPFEFNSYCALYPAASVNAGVRIIMYSAFGFSKWYTPSVMHIQSSLYIYM